MRRLRDLNAVEMEVFLGSPKYRKTALVRAREAKIDGEIETPEGIMEYKIGDYLVSDDPPTHIWPVRKEIFEATYELAED